MATTTAPTKPILVVGTDLPLGVYRAEEEEIEEHRPNNIYWVTVWRLVAT